MPTILTRSPLSVPDLRDRRGRPYYLLPPLPPYRVWLRGAPRRLIELVEYRDKLRADGKHLRGADWLEYQRLRGKADFFYFVRHIMGYDWLEWELHGRLAWAWSAPNGTVWHDQNGRRHVYAGFRMAELARGHLKSTLLTVSHAAWSIVRNPEERILIYAATDDLAESFLAPIKLAMEGGGPRGSLFVALFADIIPTKAERETIKWTTKDIVVRRVGAYTDPSIKARGIGSRIVGGHFTKQYIDDLQVEQLPKSQVDKHIRSFDGLTPMWASAATAARRMVGTPWGFLTVLSHAERNWPSSLVARIPWLDRDGRPVFERNNNPTARAEIETIMRSDPFFGACQYLVHPRREDDSGFKQEWFRRFRVEQGNIIQLDEEGADKKSIPLNECHTFTFIDPNTGRAPGQTQSAKALSEGTGSSKRDPAGFITIAIDRMSNWYILEAIRDWCPPQELMNITFRLQARWPAKFVALEQIAAQRLFVYLFREEWKRGRPQFILRPWAGGTASKEERIRGLIPRYANGFVWHRESQEARVGQGMSNLESELLDFPSAEFDDLSDALSAALPLVWSPGQSDRESWRALEDQMRAEVREAGLDRASAREAAHIRRLRSGDRATHGDAVLLGGRLDDGGTDDIESLFRPSHRRELWGDSGDE